MIQKMINPEAGTVSQYLLHPKVSPLFNKKQVEGVNGMGRSIIVAAIVMIALSGCSSEQTAKSDQPKQIEVQPEWLVKIDKLPIIYPPNTKGSPYEAILSSALMDWGQIKDEFESSSDYRKRVTQVPDKIEKMFGKFVAFRHSRPELNWDADAQLLSVNHAKEFSTKNQITLGSSQGGGVDFLYSINVQGCAANPKVAMVPDVARAVKSGVEASTVGVFYVGSFDTSRRGWVEAPTLTNHEVVPGFHRTAMPGTGSSPIVPLTADLNVTQIDFVELASGRVLASIGCS